MNTIDKIKLTAEIASRLVEVCSPTASVKDLVELAKEIIEESEKVHEQEYLSNPAQKEYRDKWGPYNIT